jgi:hypothetical protein
MNERMNESNPLANNRPPRAFLLTVPLPPLSATVAQMSRADSKLVSSKQDGVKSAGLQVATLIDQLTRAMEAAGVWLPPPLIQMVAAYGASLMRPGLLRFSDDSKAVLKPAGPLAAGNGRLFLTARPPSLIALELDGSAAPPLTCLPLSPHIRTHVSGMCVLRESFLLLVTSVGFYVVDIRRPQSEWAVHVLWRTTRSEDLVSPSPTPSSFPRELCQRWRWRWRCR